MASRNTEAGEKRRVATLHLWLLLIGAGSLWGLTFPLARIAAEGGTHAVALALWQATASAVSLAAFHLLMRWRLPLSQRHIRFYAICGFMGTALPTSLYYLAAVHVPSGVLAITVATVPMMTLVLAWLLRIERPSISRVAGLIAGIVGVAFLVLPQASLPDPAAVPWVLLVVACAACYAVENAYIALDLPTGTHPLTILFGMMIAAALMTVCVAFAFGVLALPEWPLGQPEIALLGMAMFSTVAYAVFVYLISAGGPVFASQIAYVVTLTGVAWGMVLLGEAHSAWVWAALAVMLVGLALVKPGGATDIAPGPVADKGPGF
ncbi:MAG: DMT family transporter [Pseudomonadota bacterium]